MVILKQSGAEASADGAVEPPQVLEFVSHINWLRILVLLSLEERERTSQNR